MSAPRYFKVLGGAAGLTPCHGGAGDWTPEQWMPPIADPVACARGYHVCTLDQLIPWLYDETAVWEAEVRGHLSRPGPAPRLPRGTSLLAYSPPQRRGRVASLAVGDRGAPTAPPAPFGPSRHTLRGDHAARGGVMDGRLSASEMIHVIDQLRQDLSDVRHMANDWRQECLAGEKNLSHVRQQLADTQMLLAGVVGLVQLVAGAPGSSCVDALTNHRYLDALVALDGEVTP